MAGSKFNINSLLSDLTIRAGESTVARVTPHRPTMKVISISINDLIPSSENFYDTDNIAELKLMIELLGVIEPLSVVPIGNGKYKILAGHRRHRACQALVAEGKKEFEYIPSSIESERDEIKEHIILIATNSTQRILTDYEKSRQVQEMTKLLTLLKKRDKLPGRVRDLVAEALNMSVTNVARMSAINNNLTPELKEEFKTGRLGMSTAYELSSLPENKQHEAAVELQQKGGLSLNDAREKKADTERNTAAPDCSKQECAPPYGDKDACEFHNNNVCTATASPAPRPEPKQYPETPPDFVEGHKDETDTPENQDFANMSTEDKTKATINFMNNKRFILFAPGDDTRIFDFNIEVLENYGKGA